MSAFAEIQRPFRQAARNAPYLSREEEQQLARAWRESADPAALDRIIRAHLRLVFATAHRFRHYGLPVQDLVQEGTIGLLQAADRFDTDREVRFSTYAAWWIRAAIQDYVLKNWSIVRSGASSSQKALFFNVRRLRAEISRAAEDAPLDIEQQIASRLQVSRRDVVQMESRLSGGDVSLDGTATDDDGASARIEFMPSGEPLPDEVTMQAIDSERRLGWLNSALAALSPRERSIVEARRLRDESATLESLGQELGVSKERVRQIETRALEKLRAALVGREPAMAVS